MTKKELLNYLQSFNAEMNNIHESNDAARYKSGAKQFADFLEEQGVLEEEEKARGYKEPVKNNYSKEELDEIWSDEEYDQPESDEYSMI